MASSSGANELTNILMWMAIDRQHIDNRKVKLTIQIRTIFAFSNFMKNWLGGYEKIIKL